MILIAIPARLKSSRLANKPLAQIGDYPMLWWTWQKAKCSKLANRVVIATDSQEIYDTMTALGAECIMTSENCSSGSDRIYEACKSIQEADTIVNLQGDEPLMSLEVLDGTIATLLNNNDCHIATAVSPFQNEDDWANANNVKAVINSRGKALYFSRAPLAGGYLHVGLYVYRKEALAKFCKLPASRLESLERLEQLRALEAEIPIYVYEAKDLTKEHFGVDTAEDLQRARKILLQNL